ncbi:MAG: ROK family protein [Clostridia bacterium]|nr:ROK family protein [Clostridia bacterium]
MVNIGVDLGGTNIAAGVVDFSNRIICKTSIPTNAAIGADGITRDIAGLIQSLIDKTGLSVDDIATVGVAVPGTADPLAGEVVYTANLPFLHYDIATELRKYIPLNNILTENDANAAALAEAIAGSAKGTRDSIMITLGTGVGGGIIIDGKILHGCNFAAGEVGHIVICHGDRQCSCGRTGCWEAYASATGLIATTKEYMQSNIRSSLWDLVDRDLSRVDGRTPWIAAQQGDPTALAIIDEYIEQLASGIVSMINIFQPEVLSIGGGISGQGDNLLIPLSRIVDKYQYARHSTNQTKLCIASMGNDAGIVGAAALGMQSTVK